MNELTTLNTVLGCDNLPTLPTVGVQVLTLTRNPDVSMEQIARVIETDPALSAKVLKTVNSSMFGLKSPCTTIRRALNFLGLSAVKSIVLGFSLVESTAHARLGPGYDLAAHWKRSIFSAAAARTLAQRVRSCDPEEAFAAALFQDIGALAMHTALGPVYAAAVGREPDHGRHLELEQSALGFTHAQAGAALANRWRLPDRYTQTIQHHHDADQADPDSRDLVRLVSLGTIIAGAMMASGPGEHLPALLGRARLWFGLSSAEMAPLLVQIGKDSAELGRLLGKPVGSVPDSAELLRQANEALVTQQLASMREAERLRQANQDLERMSVTDALTGLGNRKKFDAECARLFGESSTLGRSIALLMLDGDKFKSVNDTYGHHVGDAVLKELASRIAGATSHHGTACRYGGEEFAVLLAGVNLSEASSVADEIRRMVCGSPFDVSAAAGKPLQLPITVSVGVCAADPSSGHPARSIAQLIELADKQLYEAKHGGRNRVCATTAPSAGAEVPAGAMQPAPQASAESAAAVQPSASSDTAVPIAPSIEQQAVAVRRSDGSIRVLLLEDDPLAAKMVMALIQRTPHTQVEWMKSATKGTARLVEASSNSHAPVDVVVCDLGLAGGTGLAVLNTARKHLKMRHLPFAIISASEEAKDRDNCIAGGASTFICKENLVQELPAWLNKVVSGVHGNAPAHAAPRAVAGMLGR